MRCKKKGGGSLTLCNSVDGPGPYYAKQNKIVRERKIPYDFTNMWSLMNRQTNEQILPNAWIHGTD